MDPVPIGLSVLYLHEWDEDVSKIRNIKSRKKRGVMINTKEENIRTDVY